MDTSETGPVSGASTPRFALPGVRAEHLAWLALIAAAAAIRLTRLDALPLTVEESQRAFAAWQYAEGVEPQGWPGDLVSTVTAYLFRVFGADEALLRLLPAVLGTLLIPALWLLRPWLGPLATLLAALFLSFSPVMTSLSRSAIGFGLGPLLAVVLVAAAFAYLREPQGRPLLFLVGALALTPSADTVALSTALLLLAFFALRWAWGRDEGVGQALRWLWHDRWLLATAALYLAVGAVLAVGRWGAGMDRLSTPAMDAWTRLLSAADDGRPWHAGADLLVAYELPLLLAGGVGYLLVLHRWLGYSRRQVTPFQQFLVIWASAGLFLLLMGATEEGLGLLLLPLALLAGSWLAEVPRQGTLTVWPYAVLAVPLAGYVAMTALRWAAEACLGDSLERTTVLLAVVAIATLGVLAFQGAGKAALPGVLAVSLLAGAAFQAHTLTAVLSGKGSEFLMGARTTAQAPALAKALEEIASGQGGTAMVDPALWEPLAWYVRGNERIVFTRQLSSPQAMLRPVDGEAPPGYAAQGPEWYPVAAWHPPSLDLLGLWRWFVFRQPYGGSSMPAVELLVRSD